MSTYKLTKKKKQHDDYLLCSRNFLTSEQNETPKTTKRRKTSTFTNPSVRKSTIQSVHKNKPITFSKPNNQTLQNKKMKEKQSHSNQKTKKINLTRTKASNHYLSLTRIDQNQQIHKSKHTRNNSKTDHSLQKIFQRCSLILASFQQRYLEAKKENEYLKSQNKKLKQII